TTDGSYTLAVVITALCLSKGHGLPAALIRSRLCGAIAACCTAFIHTRLRKNAVLAGLLVIAALYSVNLTLLGRSNMPLLSHSAIFSWFSVFAVTDQNTLAVLIVLSAVLFFAMSFMLQIDFGIAMRATGDSESMVRAQGVNTARMKVYGL